MFLTTFLRFRILINIIQENPSREIPFRSNQLCYRLISNGCWKKTLIRINLRISSKIFRFLSKILMEYLILLRCTECIHLCRLKCIKCVSTGEGHYSYGVCVLLEHEINTHCINYCWRSKSVYAHLRITIVSMLGIIQVLSQQPNYIHPKIILYGRCCCAWKKQPFKTFKQIVRISNNEPIIRHSIQITLRLNGIYLETKRRLRRKFNDLPYPKLQFAKYIGGTLKSNQTIKHKLPLNV